MVEKKVLKKEDIAKARVVHTSGKRKKSIARATVKKGIGRVRVNSVLLEFVQPELARERIREPIKLAGQVGEQVNAEINVRSGGWSSQAEAARLAIARALVEYTGSADLKKRYLEYDRHLLIADTRRKEQRKPGTHSHARAKRQKSKR